MRLSIYNSTLINDTESNKDLIKISVMNVENEQGGLSLYKQ